MNNRNLYVCLFTVATLTQSGVVSFGVFVRSLNSRAAVVDLLDSHPGLKTHFRSQTHSVQTLLNMQIVTRDKGLKQSKWKSLKCQIGFFKNYSYYQ